MLDAVTFLCKDFHYKASHFSCWMQYLVSTRISTTEETLFHVGCRSQHLYPTMGGTNPTTMIEGNKTYIWPWEEPILTPCKKGTSLTSHHGRNQSFHHVRRDWHLYLTMGGTNTSTMSKGLYTYMWPWEAHSSTVLERVYTYIWPWEEPILPPC